MKFDSRKKSLFDQSAIDYDRYRPSYPEEAVDSIVARSRLSERSKILEIGCGSGKATVLFAKRGLNLDCVEPGERLARLTAANCARWKGVRVHTTDFEAFDCKPKSYDLLFAAQSFHWIDPTTRMQRVSSALREGGYFTLIYNYSPKPEDERLLELSQLLSDESDGALDSAWNYLSDIGRWQEEIAQSKRFDNLTLTHFPWKRTLNIEQYVGLFRTYSDFLSLPSETQGRLSEAMADFIERIGGQVTANHDCVVFHCRCVA